MLSGLLRRSPPMPELLSSEVGPLPEAPQRSAPSRACCESGSGLRRPRLRPSRGISRFLDAFMDTLAPLAASDDLGAELALAAAYEDLRGELRKALVPQIGDKDAEDVTKKVLHALSGRVYRLRRRHRAGRGSEQSEWAGSNLKGWLSARQPPSWRPTRCRLAGHDGLSGRASRGALTSGRLEY